MRTQSRKKMKQNVEGQNWKKKITKNMIKKNNNQENKYRIW
jgi:hypothetical protein